MRGPAWPRCRQSQTPEGVWPGGHQTRRGGGAMTEGLPRRPAAVYLLGTKAALAHPRPGSAGNGGPGSATPCGPTLQPRQPTMTPEMGSEVPSSRVKSGPAWPRTLPWGCGMTDEGADRQGSKTRAGSGQPGARLGGREGRGARRPGEGGHPSMCKDLRLGVGAAAQGCDSAPRRPAVHPSPPLPILHRPRAVGGPPCRQLYQPCRISLWRAATSVGPQERAGGGRRGQEGAGGGRRGQEGAPGESATWGLPCGWRLRPARGGGGCSPSSARAVGRCPQTAEASLRTDVIDRLLIAAAEPANGQVGAACRHVRQLRGAGAWRRSQPAAASPLPSAEARPPHGPLPHCQRATRHRAGRAAPRAHIDGDRALPL
jgi:hypothetical protein